MATDNFEGMLADWVRLSQLEMVVYLRLLRVTCFLAGNLLAYLGPSPSNRVDVPRLLFREPKADLARTSFIRPVVLRTKYHEKYAGTHRRPFEACFVGPSMVCAFIIISSVDYTEYLELIRCLLLLIRWA